MEERVLRDLGRKFTVKYLITHCLFWMAYACIWGFGALYLQAKGFSSTSVGVITAAGGLISAAVQPLLASKMEGDKKVTVRQVYISCMVLIVIGGTGLFFNHRMVVTAGLFLVLSAVFMSGASIINSLGMEYINIGIPVNYGLARGAGSTAYAALSLTLGFVIERFGVDAMVVICIIFSCCLIGLLLSYTSTKQLQETYGLKRFKTEEKESGGSMRQMFREDKALAVFLTGAVLVFIAHFMENTYLINLVGRFGGNDSQMGIAAACASMTELPAMVLVNYLLKKLRASKVLGISCMMFTVKAVILLGAVNMPILIASQLCQFGAYAFFTPSSVYYINERVPEHYKVTGQAALGMTTMALGGALGNLLGGRLLDVYGVIGMVTVCVALTACGTILVFASMRRNPVS